MDPARPTDSNDDGAITTLIQHVQVKRAQVDRYLSQVGARAHRLINVTIFAGTIAAAATAGPAVGGETFANRLRLRECCVSGRSQTVMEEPR
jgi:hypothetical protein